MIKTMVQASGTARRLIPATLGAVLVILLWQKAQHLDWTAVHAAFRDIPVSRWIGAGLATVLSFWAVAQYDVIAHRHFRTGHPSRAARNAGGAAIAVGQTTGFGPAVGAALRWRMLPSLGHATVLQITAFVTVAFFASWGLIAATVALPLISGTGWLALFLFPLALMSVAGLLLRKPTISLAGRSIALPSVSAFMTLVGLALCDVIFAGLALHLLLPPHIAPELPQMIAAFTLALGVGMVGGTPGGVGPFELTLITLLPGTASPEFAAALIAFRMVYYAIPCVAGAAYALLTPPFVHRQVPKRTAVLMGPRAELGIAAQNDHHALITMEAEAVALRTPQTMTLFLGCSTGRLDAILPELLTSARKENRLPCLYKLDARDAVTARQCGWHVAPFAVEAVLQPQTYDVAGPEHRQLRRFLRKAKSAGVTFARIESPDWEALTEIHCAWEERHGAERGLTMGRFCPLYLAGKPLYGAWLDGKLVAFTSWLRAPGILSLDVMRHLSDLPQGVMHGLIQKVLDDARASGITEVSLAALPHPSLPHRIADCSGLARFKTSFAPRWRPLYIGATNPVALAICAADLRRSILDPAPLRRTTEELWQLDALIDPPAFFDKVDLREAG